MTDFDLVIRNGTIATAADVFNAEIGIRDGRIAALGTGLGAGRQEIDATGLLVLPGGVDAHCHLDQPTTDGSVCADDFHSGTISAACGGATPGIPFSAPMKGDSLPPPGGGFYRPAGGKAGLPYCLPPL